MTPVFCCGFECGIYGAGHFDTALGSPTITTSSPLSGTRSLLCTNRQEVVSASTFGAGIVVWRFRIRFNTVPDRNTAVGGVGTSMVGVAFHAASSTLNMGSATGVATSGGVAVTTGVSYVVDVRVDKTANPWVTAAYINGVAVPNLNYAQAADTAAMGLSLGLDAASVVGECLIDDVIVSATSVDFPIGAGSVLPFIPTSDGTHNIAGTGDFQRGNTGTDILNATTTAFQLVDDVPLPSGAVAEADCIRCVAPPNATDYVENVFGPAAGGATPTVAPRTVEAILVHHEITTGTCNLRVGLNDNGTVNDVYNVTAAGVVTYRYARKHYATAPTGGAWTLSGAGNFNNLRVRTFSSDATPDPCLDSIMLEAEFADARDSGEWLGCYPLLNRLSRPETNLSY